MFLKMTIDFSDLAPFKIEVDWDRSYRLKPVAEIGFRQETKVDCTSKRVEGN